MSKAVMKMALDALELATDSIGSFTSDEGAGEQDRCPCCQSLAAMEYLKAELAKPESEPVAYFNMAINETVGCIVYEYEKHGLKPGTPLYTKEQA